MPETEFRITLNEQSQLTRVLEWLKRQQSFVVFWKISKRNLFELWLCRAQPASLTPPPPPATPHSIHKTVAKTCGKIFTKLKIRFVFFSSTVCVSYANISMSRKCFMQSSGWMPMSARQLSLHNVVELRYCGRFQSSIFFIHVLNRRTKETGEKKLFAAFWLPFFPLVW